MKPVPPSTKGALRRHLKRHGPLSVFQIINVIRERGWAWPVQRVTQKRVNALCLEMGLHNESGYWQAEPPTIEERAATFLRRLEQNRSTACGYDGDEAYYRGEGNREAIDEAISDFKRLFPELVSPT